jgi:hypothetical protein
LVSLGDGNRAHAAKRRPYVRISAILCGILAVIDEEIKALKWNLWQGELEPAICALEKILWM